MFPHNPQSLGAMRARFLEAIAESKLEFAKHGSRAECVFDFKDGVRLIVSRTPLPLATDRQVIHVSASARPGSSSWRRLQEADGGIWFTKIVACRFADLAEGNGMRGTVRLQFVECDEHGVPHWQVECVSDGNEVVF
jgi:hypothetical protein